MMNTTFKRISKVAMVAFGFALIVLGGCAGQGDSLNANNATLKVYSGANSNCSTVFAGSDIKPRYSNSVFAGSDIKPRRGFAINAETKTCSGVTVDVSGSVEGADSVLINVNGQEYSVTVDANGSFHAQIPADAAPESVTITPMTGDMLGAALVVSPTSV